MPTTLGSLYRDINSRLSDAGVNEQKIFHLDVIKAVNDAIIEYRQQYIQNGFIEDFLQTETLWFASSDQEYPFLYSTHLCDKPLQNIPFQQSMFRNAEKELKNETQTWDKGDLSIKNNTTYKALENILNTNTFNKTFDVKNIKNYTIDNGFVYSVDEIAYNASDDTYWRCINTYTNDKGETINGSGAFEQLFWVKVDRAYHEGVLIDFSNLHQLKLTDGIKNHYPFSINKDKVYVTNKTFPLTLTYVPEWKRLDDLEDKLNLPETMIPEVKMRTLQTLAQKLGLELHTQQQENS